MSKNTRLLLPVFILIFSLLACNTVTIPTTAINVDAVGTAAAQTVAAAIGSVAPAGDTAVPPAAATTAAPNPAVPTNTPPPVPTSTNTNVPPPTAICDQAAFVSETVPDGTEFAPGTNFTKSWRLRNTGACTWTPAYAAVFFSGDALNAPAVVPFTGNIAPGQEVDVVVNMKAPMTPGTYIGNWKLRNASSVIFGLGPSAGLYLVKIVVPEPTPTATSGFHVLVPAIPLGPFLLAPSVQQVYASSPNIPAGGVGSGTVTCPSGSVVTSGGFAANSKMIAYTQLQSGNGWQVYAKNNDSADNFITVYAVCLKNTSGTTNFKLASTSIASGANGTTTAACPAGSVVTGGGFATSADALWVYNSSMNGNGWQVYARNFSGSSAAMNVYAICLSGTTGVTTQAGNNTTVPSGTYGSANAACPSGKLVTGGGYALSNDLSVYNSSMNTGDSTKWNVFANNTGASGMLMNVYAICISFP